MLKKDKKNKGLINKKSAQVEYQEPFPQLNFDAWFAKVSTERNFNPSLKEALKLHFQANGFMENKKFDEGLKHFGF